MNDYKQKFIEYLEANDIKYRDSGEKIQHVCLNIEHQEENPSAFTSFVNPEEPFCHCSSCKWHLNTESFLTFIGHGNLDKTVLFKSKMNRLFKQIQEQKELRVVTKNKVNDWKSRIFLPPKYKDFNEYGKSYRGISPETFAKVNCFVTDSEHYYKKRLIFPLYDYKNNLKGFDAVSVFKDTVPKVLRSKGCLTDSFFGFENLLGQDFFKNKDTVFISEGLFSALSFIELGYQGLFNFGVATIEDKLEVLYKKGIKQIIFCGDKDEVGFKFNSEMYHLLKKSFKVKFFKHPWRADEKSDSNDYLKKDQLQELINKTLSIK